MAWQPATSALPSGETPQNPMAPSEALCPCARRWRCSVRPFSSRLGGKNKKLQPLRYSAARLCEMGVLLDIQDLPASQCVLRPRGV